MSFQKSPDTCMACLRYCGLYLCAIACVAFVPAGVAAAQGSAPPGLRVDLSMYPWLRNVDNDVDMTAQINARIAGRFSYFSYINMSGTVNDGAAVFVRSEQNLRYKISKQSPLDLNFQGVLVRGDGNDYYQFGLGWRVHDTPGLERFFDRINTIYRITLHFKRFEFDDSDVWQVEHFFRTNISKRFYLSGFVDQTFDLDTPGAPSSSPVVAEIQLGMRLFDNFYAVTEYRKTDFRVGDETNLAAGLEYKFRW